MQPFQLFQKCWLLSIFLMSPCITYIMIRTYKALPYVILSYFLRKYYATTYYSKNRLYYGRLGTSAFPAAQYQNLSPHGFRYLALCLSAIEWLCQEWWTDFESVTVELSLSQFLYGIVTTHFYSDLHYWMLKRRPSLPWFYEYFEFTSL